MHGGEKIGAAYARPIIQQVRILSQLAQLNKKAALRRLDPSHPSIEANKQTTLPLDHEKKYNTAGVVSNTSGPGKKLEKKFENQGEPLEPTSSVYDTWCLRIDHLTPRFEGEPFPPKR